MDDLQTFCQFHDWYIDTLAVPEGNRLTLGLKLEDQRATVTFIGTSRCVVEHFGTLNIVYDIKIVEQGEARHEQALALLTKTARTSKPKGRLIAWVAATAGAEVVVEFDSLEIRTL